jgi:hypothetical protein
MAYLITNKAHQRGLVSRATFLPLSVSCPVSLASRHQAETSLLPQKPIVLHALSSFSKKYVLSAGSGL